MKILEMQHKIRVKGMSFDDKQMLLKAGYRFIREGGGEEEWQICEAFNVDSSASQWKANKRLSQVTPPAKV